MVRSLLLLRWWPTETLRFCGVGSKIQATTHPRTPTRWPDDDVRDGLNIMAQRHSEGNAAAAAPATVCRNYNYISAKCAIALFILSWVGAFSWILKHS